MHTSTHIYHHNDQELHGFLAVSTQKTKVPVIIILHDWSGLNDFAKDVAKRMAELGYMGFAADLYGNGTTGNTIEEKQALMKPLISDRGFLQQRLLATLNAVKQLPMVNSEKIIVMGFCFGGLCALDLARSGAQITGAVSFHGLLHQPDPSLIKPIKANILVFHGYNDPMVSPQDVETFCQEMDDSKTNWQLHTYGQTQHAFMVPSANNTALGTLYQPETAQRAWQILNSFLTEQCPLS